MQSFNGIGSAICLKKKHFQVRWEKGKKNFTQTQEDNCDKIAYISPNFAYLPKLLQMLIYIIVAMFTVEINLENFILETLFIKIKKLVTIFKIQCSTNFI